MARGSLVSIEALEASALINWEWHGVEAIAEREPSMERLLRRVAGALYVRKIEREFEMLTLSAAQRYQRFVQSQPGAGAGVTAADPWASRRKYHAVWLSSTTEDVETSRCLC